MKYFKPNYDYIPDTSLNLLEARKTLIVKCLKDFPELTLENCSKKLGISPRELHREMKDMKIVRHYHNSKYLLT